MTVTILHHRFENLIQLTSVGPLLRLERGGEAVAEVSEPAQGVEVLPALTLWRQCTYTLVCDGAGGRRVARIPMDQASLGNSYELIPLRRLHMDFHFVGPRINDANGAATRKHGSFDEATATATFDQSETIRHFKRVDSLGNQPSEEAFSYGTRVRSAFRGIRLSLEDVL